MKKIFSLSLLLASGLLLSACGKQAPAAPTPTPAPKVIELETSQKPYISLIPRADGHNLTLKVNNIPSMVSSIEYELLYTAVDDGNEIEKGVGDTIKNVSSSLERDLLLGTASCTNGCKYKYDAGVNGGTLSLNLITKEGQVVTYESAFALKTTADIKKEGSLGLPDKSISIVGSGTATNYYVLLKNFGVPSGSGAQSAISVFSSASDSGKFTSINPTTYTKSSTTLTGDYLQK